MKPNPHDDHQVDQLFRSQTRKCWQPQKNGAAPRIMDGEVGPVPYMFLDFKENASNLTTRGMEAVGAAAIPASSVSRRASRVDNSAWYSTAHLQVAVWESLLLSRSGILRLWTVLPATTSVPRCAIDQGIAPSTRGPQVDAGGSSTHIVHKNSARRTVQSKLSYQQRR